MVAIGQFSEQSYQRAEMERIVSFFSEVNFFRMVRYAKVRMELHVVDNKSYAKIPNICRYSLLKKPADERKRDIYTIVQVLPRRLKRFESLC